jgi:hypothetical protein
MKPEDLAKSGTESGEQRAVMAWAALNRANWPELEWLHHIPNGGSRGDDARSRMIRGANLKAEGVRDGVFDLSLPCARIDPAGTVWHGLYIEMKAPGKIKDTSDAQKRFGAFLSSQSYAWRVCDTWTMAVATLTEFLNWKRV